jgi:pimeloyl-ACP methyl ester carboxylesterase
MKLFFKKTGEGKPLIILHGLFGLGDNWGTLAKEYASVGFAVYLVDLRNHGRSPHSEDFSYPLMAEDVFELMQEENMPRADFIGHSMGGKVLMFFSAMHAGRIDRMVIADMAPRYYPPHHQAILSALHSVDLARITTRREAEEKLRDALKDEAVIQFLLKNLYWKEEGRLDWRFYLPGIERNMEKTGIAFQPDHEINSRVLFLRGENSGYIGARDEIEIRKIFPHAQVDTIKGAGHWVHAEKPKEFFEKTNRFIKKKED